MNERSPSQAVSYRPLTANDVDALLDLWHGAGLPVKLGGRDKPEKIIHEMSLPQVQFLGAWRESQLVGVLLVNHEGRKGWINRLAVSPDHHHQGIARRLVDLAISWLRSQGIEIYAALIESSNSVSQALFLDLGFVNDPGILYFSRRDHSGV